MPGPVSPWSVRPGRAPFQPPPRPHHPPMVLITDRATTNAVIATVDIHFVALLEVCKTEVAGQERKMHLPSCFDPVLRLLMYTTVHPSYYIYYGTQYVRVIAISTGRCAASLLMHALPIKEVREDVRGQVPSLPNACMLRLGVDGNKNAWVPERNWVVGAFDRC